MELKERIVDWDALRQMPTVARQQYALALISSLFGEIEDALPSADRQTPTQFAAYKMLDQAANICRKIETILR